MQRSPRRGKKLRTKEDWLSTLIMMLPVTSSSMGKFISSAVVCKALINHVLVGGSKVLSNVYR